MATSRAVASAELPGSAPATEVAMDQVGVIGDAEPHSTGVPTSEVPPARRHDFTTTQRDLHVPGPRHMSGPTRPRAAMSLQLAWLHSFLAVANSGGLGAAAQALQLPPSQVNAHVEALERALGVTLFDYRVQPVHLTEAAKTFRAYAVTALLELQRGIDAAGAFHGSSASRISHLRVGASPGLISTYLPSVMRELNAAHPGLVVEFIEAGPARLAEMIADGSVDLALRPLLPKTPDFAWCHRVIWREEVVAVLCADDPLAEQSLLTVKDLLERTLIGTSANAEEESGGSDLRAALGAAVTRTNGFYPADQPRALVALVRSGFGIGVIGRLALDNVSTEGLAVRAIGSPTAHRDMAVFWTGRSAENVGITAFLDAQTRAPLPPACLPPTNDHTA